LDTPKYVIFVVCLIPTHYFELNLSRRFAQVDHKEGVRFLSRSFPNDAPNEVKTLASAVAMELDTLAMNITKRLGKCLRISPTAIALRADLPVAYGKHVGMFDIARYFNERAGQAPPAEGESIDDVNCVPHYDPGLVSISFFSNQEGLQLFDPSTNQWYAGPVNTVPGQEKYGVLWLGDAAAKVSEGKWKAGVHRVIYPALQGPRLTMWYEACTVAQVNGPDDSKPVPEGQIQLPNVKGPGKMMKVSKNETQTAVLMRIERRRGLPMSKIAIVDDDFKVRL
jgi:isopenicillin N synthase-like dioxygenase